jgi:Protease inhibitor Inh
MTRLAIFAAAFFWMGAVLAQAPPAPAVPPTPATPPAEGESAKKVIGTWEFSNADHDKVCTAVFKADKTAVGFKVEFDANCGTLFPLVNDIAGWTYANNDLLNLLDAQGKPLVEFSEVEDGIFEAPTPGVGVLFLQTPAAATAEPAPDQPDRLAGNWTIARSNGGPLCKLTLAATAAGEGFALTVQPGCAKSIDDLKFTQWQLKQGELTLVPAKGNPWRFEEVDTQTWRRISEGAVQMILVRQ